MKSDLIASTGGQSLPTIHMFWHGPPLSRLEQLCVTSFVSQGHPVNLYLYDELKSVPAGVRVMDAAQVLARDCMYLHRRTGSVGLFTDWFRYCVLLKQGGIWVDTDVVCLKPFAYPDPVIFAWQDEKSICGAVLGLPAGHELASWLADCCVDPNRLLPYDSLRMKLRKLRRRYLQGNRRDRIRWGEYGPWGLTLAARHFGYTEKALPSRHFFPVHYKDWHRLFESTRQHPIELDGSYGVHLWNNMMQKKPGFDKNGRFPADSVYEQLCRRYLKDGD